MWGFEAVGRTAIGLATTRDAKVDVPSPAVPLYIPNLPKVATRSCTLMDHPRHVCQRDDTHRCRMVRKAGLFLGHERLGGPLDLLRIQRQKDTASRAREKPLPKELAHLDIRPLRSDQDPWGHRLPRSQKDKARVLSANKLYVLTVVAMTILISRGAKVSCENLSGSHFWVVARRAADQLGLIESWTP